MKDTYSLLDRPSRNRAAAKYSSEVEARLIERRLARLQGFVAGMVVMAALILCAGAFCLGA